MNGHPTDVELFDLAEGKLNPVRAANLQRHLDTCAACQTRQTRQFEAIHQLGETLMRVGSASAFSPDQSWAAIAPRLATARRTEHVAQILRLAASAAMVLLLVMGGIGMNILFRPQPVVEPQTTPPPAVIPAVVSTVSPTIAPTPQPLGRITVLVAGVDLRPGETHPGQTDSLLLLSMDRTRQTALMLSIPRDLWVDIPGHGPNRINTAYALGEEDHTGGAALLKQTASNALGVRIDHVVRLDFSVAIRLIDAIGGVEIDVPADIDDPLFPDAGYGYEPLFIPAGRQHFDGTLALKYMRTRHGSSDFDRAARQQQVLTAVREKLSQLDTWSDLLKRAPELFTQLQGAIATDMNVAEMIELAQQAREVPDGALHTAVLDGRYVVDYVTPEGAQVLLPLKDRISALVTDAFETGLAPATPEVEMARLAVLNGTTQTGLAARTDEFLRGRGFNVVSAGNADHSRYAQTIIIDHAGRPATVRALAELLQVAPGNLLYHPNPASSAEVEIILGADFTLPLK